MKKYTIDEVAVKLKVNKETVRRWIRNNELAAILNSKKEGYVIEEHSLIAFLELHPKYIHKNITVELEFSKTHDRKIKYLQRLIEIESEINKLIKEKKSIMKEL